MIAINERKKMLAGGAAIALLAGVGGLLIGRSGDTTQVSVTAPAAKLEAEAKEEGSGREGFVEMNPERLKATGILTERVAAGSLGSEIIAQASVTAPPEGSGALTARADGAVTRISKRLGDAVAAGETVALIESRDAAAIVAERSAAAAAATAARAAHARELRLFRARVTAKQDLEAAQAALAQAEAEARRTQAATAAAGVTSDGRHIAARSPISGRITKVTTELGAYVLAGAELFEVSNPRSVQVEAAVPAQEAQRISPGDLALIELPGGGTVVAVVRSTTPSLNAESRTATVILQPQGTPAGLTQGQGVRARITPRGSVTDGRIVLPQDAIQTVEGRTVVFVQVKGGFQATPVTVGTRSGGRVEIIDGLKPGVVVVTTGAFALKSQLGASEAEH